MEDVQDPSPSIIATPHRDTTAKVVVIGEFAVMLHGGPRKDTADVDFGLNSKTKSYDLEKQFKTLITNHPKIY